MLHKIKQKMQHYSHNHLIRQIKKIDESDGRLVSIDGKQYINFSSNDYLGLSKSARVKKAFVEGVNLYGCGSGSSALLAGYYSPMQKLEEAFAQKLGTEQAMLFNSGYHANIGLIQALDMPIVMDKLCHASIIDGARLSGHKFYRYRDLKTAEALLSNKDASILISERVFSMEGNITNIVALKDLSSKHKSLLIIDDAHGFGILENDIKADLIVVPLGKTLGSVGAIVAGSKELIDYLRQFARSYIYSTALPPAIAYASLTSLKLMEEETWRLAKLKQLIKLFNHYANEAGLNLITQCLTPIRSILIDNDFLAKTIESKLQNRGFFVKAIVRPTVQTSRLRISLCAHHEESDVIELIEVINEGMF